MQESSRNILRHDLYDDFLYRIPKVQSTEAKIEKLDYKTKTKHQAFTQPRRQSTEQTITLWNWSKYLELFIQQRIHRATKGIKGKINRNKQSRQETGKASI